MSLRFSSVLLVALSSAALGACKKESNDAPLPAASAAPRDALDPELAQAVAAASAAKPGAAGSVKEGEPPPNGIFSIDAADKAAPKDSLPKLTLGGEGAGPKVSLGPAQPSPGKKTSGSIQVEMQNDPRQPGLPIDFAVTLETLKPKDAPTGPGPVNVVARVTSAKITIPGAPADLVADVAKLRGSKVEYQIMPDGAGTGFKHEVAKGAPSGFGEMIRAMSDALSAVTLSQPTVPLGAGAYWMTTSRDSSFGIDLVSYRLMKVEAIQGDKVTLSVNTKRYAAGPTVNLAELPPDAPRELAEFQGVAEGKLELSPGLGFPLAGEQQSMIAAALGKSKGGLTLQARARTKVSFPAPK